MKLLKITIIPLFALLIIFLLNFDPVIAIDETSNKEEMIGVKNINLYPFADAVTGDVSKASIIIPFIIIIIFGVVTIVNLFRAISSKKDLLFFATLISCLTSLLIYIVLFNIGMYILMQLSNEGGQILTMALTICLSVVFSIAQIIIQGDRYTISNYEVFENPGVFKIQAILHNNFDILKKHKQRNKNLTNQYKQIIS